MWGRKRRELKRLVNIYHREKIMFYDGDVCRVTQRVTNTRLFNGDTYPFEVGELVRLRSAIGTLSHDDQEDAIGKLFFGELHTGARVVFVVPSTDLSRKLLGNYFQALDERDPRAQSFPPPRTDWPELSER
jgi:hypothetical protein